MQIIVYKRRPGEVGLHKCFTTELICASDDILVVQSPQKLEGGMEDAYFVDIGAEGDQLTAVKFDDNNQKDPPFTLIGRIMPNTAHRR